MPKFSKSTSLFELLSAQADFLTLATERLSALVKASPAERRELNHALHDAEQGADEASHAVLRLVNQSFVLPFDREDLYALVNAIDNVIDLVDEAGDNVVLYKPSSLPDGVTTQIELLSSCATVTAAALKRISTINETMREYWIEINDLENQGDKLYRHMIADLFEGSTDALEVLRVKSVLDALEGALDAFETLSGVVETIALKES